VRKKKRATKKGMKEERDMHGWMVYIHKKRADGTRVVGGCIPGLVWRIICLRSSLSRCLMIQSVGEGGRGGEEGKAGNK